ncbi:MAG: ABC transporter ATP-binding protein, partial [Deltaproteobacteria bacterium]|nr:ABC transporter ATP-binding protein [Deltaproteobacteria bacterium]
MKNNAAPPAVQFKGVVKRFDKVVAVAKMDLDIEEGS